MAPKKSNTQQPPEDAPPRSGTGKFIYSSQTHQSPHYYQGDWEIVLPEPDPNDKKAKKAPEPSQEELNQYRKRHGNGSYHYGKLTYEGEWANDKMHGNGEMQFPNGDQYSGQFHEGAIQGEGKYRFANGAWYEGQFQSNRMHGTGLYVTKDGRRFHGTFYNGVGPGLERELIDEELPTVVEEKLRQQQEEQVSTEEEEQA